MKVAEYIKERLSGHRPLHMTLIDPAKQEPSRAAEIAAMAEKLGTDAVMVGGSTGVTQDNLDQTVLAIKRVCKIPVIYFPSGAHAISRYSDAIYFMSMLNSRNLKNVIREQVAAAPIVTKLGLEPISMGYIIVEPGMKVGEVGEADVVKRQDIPCAVAYCEAAQFMGMDLVYLEAGSGAPYPVPAAMVAEVKKTVKIPLVVGGGIREPEQARELRAAGADVIVTGTVVENGAFGKRLKGIIQAIKD
jgi:phosphoglycerol geranylgeranyltransferase